MSSTKMLIDATHPEETRVVVQRNGRVEEFDFESAARKLLRGNIYLAKVTRVEPSLQAAFVDYGGNRHGFLAFNEIHPDYYQIPVADRQALLEEEAAAEAELEAAADRRAEALARRGSGRGGQGSGPRAEANNDDFGEPTISEAPVGTSHIVDVEEEEHIEEVGGQEDGEEAVQVIAAAIDRSTEDVRSELPPADRGSEEASDEDAADDEDDDAADGNEAASESGSYSGEAGSEDREHRHEGEGEDDDHESEAELSQQDAQNGSDRAGSSEERSGREFRDESPARQRRRPRSYKIQEVIKRRQIILVQVVKEERGNKGAALTTYLSLAGRYTVLMPNTARGGGISRKITNPQDRRRLKSIAQELEVPEGMGLIIRTAGAARTKQEIKRDFEYLLRLWESVRELTLQSTAPSLVYEEGDLIKRSIRDLYNKDVEEIVVAGEAGYHEAAAFMQMLMPSHIKNVAAYKDPTPLFTRYAVERQLNAMFQPQVTLRSGGYIVINQTEALVAIDVNSGKSTREFSIEETALATNLEAADEIARQLKLRDLAGLIVIDFIDMEEKRNNRAVERRLKDALRFDRARIQLGRISHFGLMEMSRQRLRTGVLEGSTSQCPHCQGTGIIRSTESVALAVLRGLEDAITAGANGPLVATTTPAVALYILNSKRTYIADMETRHGHTITVLGSDRVHGANFTVERGAASALPVRRAERAAVNMDWGFDGEEEEAPSPEVSDIEVAPEADDSEDEGSERESRDGNRGDGDENGARRGRRRRRRGRGGRERGEGRERVAYEAGGGDSEALPNAPERASQPVDDFEPGAAEGEAGEQPALDDAAYADRPDDGRGDRPGRRRRRGRRGGRRGRERRPGEAATEGGEGGSYDGEQPEIDDDQPDVAATPEAAPPAAAGRAAQARAADNDHGAVVPTEAKVQRQRRIWDVPPAANGADAAPAAAPSAKAARHPEPIVEAETPAPPPPVRRRHEVGSSEPRIERVVVKPGDESGASEASEQQATPQRKGWWQRKFSGE
jgi:ribonuclease E